MGGNLYREELVQALKDLIQSMSSDDIKGLWRTAIHAWMRTIAFGHTV